MASAHRAERAGAVVVTLTEDAVDRATERLDHARSRLRLLSPTAQVEQGFLRLDDLTGRLSAALKANLQLQRQRLADARSLLGQRSPERRVQMESHRLLALWKRLQAASPKSVLNRGFVILRDDAGRAVPKKKGLEAGERLTAEFGDGMLPMRVE